MIPLGPPPSVYAFPVHHPEMFAKVDGPDPGSEPQDLAGANRAGGGDFIMWSWSNCLHGFRAIAALAVVAALWSAASPALAEDQQQPPPPEQQQQRLSDQELQQLVAPIALYPDPLLAQILTASTYPLEVVMAARWSKDNPDLKGQDLENAMQKQPWDPSVKGLAAVPQVLVMMNDKLDWTQQLGEAFLAQAVVVLGRMAGVAVMRCRTGREIGGQLAALVLQASLLGAELKIHARFLLGRE